MDQPTVNELEALDTDMQEVRALYADATSMLQLTLEDAIDQLEDPDDPFAKPTDKLDGLIQRLEAGEKLPSLDDLLTHARGIRQSSGMKP